MPFQRQRAELRIDDGVRLELERISRSRTESARRVERAKLLLGYVAGEPISAIARSLNTNRPKVYRCVRKALDVGALPALDDLPRRGRPATISAGSRAWLLALACRKPCGAGLRRGVVDGATTGRARSEALSGRWASGPVERGPGNGVEDPGPSGGATAQDQLLPGTAGPRVRREDGAGAVFLSRSGTGPRARGGSGRTARGLPLVRRKARHPGGRHDLARPAAGTGRARHGRPRPRVRAPWHGHLDGRDGPAHGACAPSRGGSASKPGVRRVPAGPGQGLSPKHDAATDPRQPFGPPLQGNAHLARQRAQPVRVRVHVQARIVAEPDRDVLQQSGKNRVAWNPCRLDGRTQGTSRTLHRWDQRRTGGVQVDLWNQRCDPSVTVFRKRTTSVWQKTLYTM